MFSERIEQLRSISGNDPDVCILIDSLVRSCKKYDYYVAQMNLIAITGQVDSQDSEGYRNAMQEMDRSRRFTHLAVVGHVQALDRMCQRYGVRVIYGENYADNRATSAFAVALARELER